MKRFTYFFLAVIFLFTSHVFAQEKEICFVENADLSCLKKNFNSLYSTNYSFFWMILRNAAEKAQNCSSIFDTMEFISLNSHILGNAEVEEYFREITENIFVTHSDCYMKVLLELNETSRIELVDRLRNPLFTDENKIRQVFLKYRDLGEFTLIIELYFGDK